MRTRTRMTPEQRVERARTAGLAANTISNYVQRICRNPADLSDEDLAALRQLVPPVDVAQAYKQGLQHGAKLTAEKVLAAVSEVAA